MVPALFGPSSSNMKPSLPDPSAFFTSIPLRLHVGSETFITIYAGRLPARGRWVFARRGSWLRPTGRAHRIAGGRRRPGGQRICARRFLAAHDRRPGAGARSCGGVRVRRRRIRRTPPSPAEIHLTTCATRSARRDLGRRGAVRGTLGFLRATAGSEGFRGRERTDRTARRTQGT